MESMRPRYAGCPQLSTCYYPDQGLILRFLVVTLQDMDFTLLTSVPVLSAMTGMKNW